MSDYKIQPGDTLSKIAKQYGVTVKQLQEANGIKNPNLIFAGKDLKIPVEDDGAFKIPGLTIEPSMVPMYGVPVKPSGGTINPTFPTTPTSPTIGDDPNLRTVYAVIVKPSDGKLPTIAPSDTIKPGDIRTLYAAPIKPSGGTIKPSDIKLPTLPVDPTIPKPPKEKIGVTPEQKKEAETLGKYTARYLAGYTTDTEQQAIIDNVNRIKTGTVKDFLESYEAHRNDEAVKAEPFFSQVLHEWGFDEKQDVMKRVALRLAAHLAEAGNSVDAAKIRNILKKDQLTGDDTKLLDKIYQHYLE